MRNDLPLIALTMGDVAGIGPEVIARAWSEPALFDIARPIVVGDSTILRRALQLVQGRAEVVPILTIEEAPLSPSAIPCLDAATVSLRDVAPGQVDARAGRAAYDFLIKAIDLARSGHVQAITTLPLNKESL